MRNPKFKEIRPNYRKNTLEVTLQEGRRITHYGLPFAALGPIRAGVQNRFAKITIDQEVNEQAAYFELQDGTRGSFSSDLLLYHFDPTYDWSPINQIKRRLKGKLGKSKLSVQVVADALKTAPSQVMRVLEENRGSKHLSEFFQLAELAGYRIQFQLKKKSAA